MMTEYKGYTIEIVPDEDAMHPRKDCDNFGTIIHWYRHYDLGEFVGPAEAGERIAGAVSLPVYMYDHCDITINTTGFSCPWDSGQVGFIYATREQVLKEYGGKYMTKRKRQKALELLRAEIEEYDQYLRGDVYGFVIRKEDEVIDACYGFYGDDHCLSEAKEVIDHLTRGTHRVTGYQTRRLSAPCHRTLNR